MQTADAGPLGAAEFKKLVEAVRAAVAEAVAEAATVPQLLNGLAARRYVGMSKSAWHRAKSAGLLPATVYVEGSGEVFRRADLDRFVERLKPRRKRRAKQEEESETGQGGP